MSIQSIKDYIKYITRKYLDYDVSLLLQDVPEDFIDQKNLVPDASVIFDVGANIGQTTRKYRKLFPQSLIYAFEPFPEIFHTYMKNTRGDKHVHISQIALSDKIGTASFFVNNLHYTNSLLQVADAYKDETHYKARKEIQVQTDTLDHFCTTQGIDHIDILKMDIQGGELLALTGAQNLLASGAIDLIYTEVLSTEIYTDQPFYADIERFLSKYNYRVYKKYDGDIIFLKGNTNS